jgi:hypothetical protein
VYLRGQSPGHPGKDGSGDVGEHGKGLITCHLLLLTLMHNFAICHFGWRFAYVTRSKQRDHIDMEHPCEVMRGSISSTSSSHMTLSGAHMLTA